MKRVVMMAFSPVLCLGLLSGLYAERQRRINPEDADAYHAQARTAIENVPYQLNGWVGRDEEVTAAAVKLLRPNIILQRTYLNPSKPASRAGLLIVQCRDSRDMLGHYPPVCYPAHGMSMKVNQPKDWVLPGLKITGFEYLFTSSAGFEQTRMVVYNFMVVPELGIVRDMQGVGEAAADYQRRYFGAAQVQVTLPAALSETERQEVFVALIGPLVPMLKSLSAGGNQ